MAAKKAKGKSPKQPGSTNGFKLVNKDEVSFTQRSRGGRWKPLIQAAIENPEQAILIPLEGDEEEQKASYKNFSQGIYHQAKALNVSVSVGRTDDGETMVVCLRNE